MNTLEQVKAFQDGYKAGAKRCLELCENEVMKINPYNTDAKDGAVSCCAVIAKEFGLEGK